MEELRLTDEEIHNFVARLFVNSLDARVVADAQLSKARQYYELEKTEAVSGVLDYVESMFPELESTYWQGKNWKRFRKEQALSGEK